MVKWKSCRTVAIFLYQMQIVFCQSSEWLQFWMSFESGFKSVSRGRAEKFDSTSAQVGKKSWYCSTLCCETGRGYQYTTLRLSIALIPGFVQFRTQSLNWNEYLIIQRHSKPYHSTELFFTNFRKSILKIWIEVLRTNVGTSRENLKRYTYAIQAILCNQDEGAVANHEICIHSFCNLIAF